MHSEHAKQKNASARKMARKEPFTARLQKHSHLKRQVHSILHLGLVQQRESPWICTLGVPSSDAAQWPIPSQAKMLRAPAVVSRQLSRMGRPQAGSTSLMCCSPGHDKAACCRPHGQQVPDRPLPRLMAAAALAGRSHLHWAAQHVVVLRLVHLDGGLALRHTRVKAVQRVPDHVHVIVIILRIGRKHLEGHRL